MNLHILVLFGFLLCSGVLGKYDRIVGGELADITNYSYQVGVKLLSINLFLCGGSLVSDKHALSAAHCFLDREEIWDDMRVFYGTTYLNDTTHQKKIIDVDIHPQYTGVSTVSEGWVHDLVVLTLESAVTFSPTINKIALPSANVADNVVGIITGWGKTALTDVQPSNQLRHLSMKIISKRQCTSYFKRDIHKTQICVTHPQGAAACHGDSGGPLVVGGKIVGILSWIVPCAKGYPDIYTNVFEHMEFINYVLRKPL